MAEAAKATVRKSVFSGGVAARRCPARLDVRNDPHIVLLWLLSEALSVVAVPLTRRAGEGKTGTRRGLLLLVFLAIPFSTPLIPQDPIFTPSHIRQF